MSLNEAFKLEVSVGRDGWLFLTGGTNDVIRFYSDPDYFSDALKGQWIERLASRAERCRELGIGYAHVIAPEKLSVYPEFFEGSLTHPECAPSQALPAAIKADDTTIVWRGILLDTLAFFKQQKLNGVQIYWKTDTHWNFYGAFSVYQILADRFGARIDAHLMAADEICGDIPLDLGSKMKPPVLERFCMRQLLTRAERTYANALVRQAERDEAVEHGGTLHVGSHVVFKNDNPTDPRKIVLFGDSFSEYRPHLLTGLLAETFAETHFIWSGAVDWGYVERVRPDLMVTEMSERFMNRVPDDDFDVETFAEERLAGFRASRSKLRSIAGRMLLRR